MDVFFIRALIAVLDLHNLLVKEAVQIAKFMRPTLGPPGSCRPQVASALAPWTLLSGCWCSPYSQKPMSAVSRYEYLFAVYPLQYTHVFLLYFAYMYTRVCVCLFYWVDWSDWFRQQWMLWHLPDIMHAAKWTCTFIFSIHWRVCLKYWRSVATKLPWHCWLLHRACLLISCMQESLR